MSVSFDWDFQDDESSPWDYKGAPSPRRRVWPARVLVVLVLLVVVGLGAYVWVKGRLGKVETVEAELRHVVEAELKSIRDGDAELFYALQDPQAFGWQDSQVVRYFSGHAQTGGLAPAPGLSPARQPVKIEKVRVFGRDGRVELLQWFQSAQPGSFPFRRTWFYRLDEDGTWYHTPPPDDQVGGPYSWHGTWLEIYATALEAGFLDDVADDLILLVYRGCRLLDCSPDEHYALVFDEAVAEPKVYFVSDRWKLPPLYLTGVPDDAAARQVWLRALKLWLVEALALSHVGDDVSERVIYRQLVARLQAELGLIEPPAPDDVILARALEAGEQHPLWSLWQARYDPGDPQKARLLKAEATALLQFIESQAGDGRFFALLPALDDYERLGDALADLYGLERLDVTRAWSAYLSQLAGVDAVAGLDLQTEFADPSLHLLQPPASRPPGNQVALNCDGQILAGNLDGSDVAPLTPGGYYFTDPLWSPDGRWLLTTQRQGTSFLLASDGSELRPFPDGPSPLQALVGQSLDGRRIYYVGPDGQDQAGSVWVMDVETGARRELPVWRPVFSPDGRRVAYFKQPYQGLADVLWLADVNDAAALGQEWEDTRRVEWGTGTLLAQSVWSPDGTKLALNLYSEHADAHMIAMYDLESGQLTPLATLAELADALLSGESLLASEADPAAILAHGPLVGLSIEGWSADASRLAVKVYRDSARGTSLRAVLEVPLGGAPPRVLALAEEMPDMEAHWSPTDPGRLILIQRGRGILASQGHLLDLESGPLYTATQSAHAAWSPDGAWVAFAEVNQNTVVDQEGQPRFTWRHDCDFAPLFWNPAADLSPQITCRAGLDLWIGAQDVHRAGEALTFIIHNSGTQGVENVVLDFETRATESEVMRLDMGRAVPPCGVLLLHGYVLGDWWKRPLSVRVSAPGGTEENLENNQVTLHPSAP